MRWHAWKREQGPHSVLSLWTDSLMKHALKAVLCLWLLGCPLARGQCPPCPESNNPCFWFRGEYLLWWTKSAPVSVPLVTTFPIDAITPSPGTPGDPSTQVVLGNQHLGQNLRSGARFTLGGWLDGDQTLGAEGSYLFLRSKTTTR